MGEGPRGIKVFQDHFQASTSGAETSQTGASNLHTKIEFEHHSSSHLWTARRLRSVTSMLNLFNLKRLPWRTDTNGKQKLVLSATEVESLRSELADLEEREAQLKAQLEHIDETLRAARLSGYLQMRTRWTALPGEPAPLDDTEVDDWLPRFVVLQGPCIFLYFKSMDISSQDSTLLSDVVEVGRMPCVIQEEGETRHYFYIVTRQGLRYECSSASKLQVDAWVTTLQEDSNGRIMLTYLYIHIIDPSRRRMSSRFYKSASRAARSLLSSASKHRHHVVSEGRTAVAAATVSYKGKLPALVSFCDSSKTSNRWIASALALPAAAYMLQDQEAHAAQMERTFIAIKPDGVQTGLISEIIHRFERKGFKLVAIKLVVPSKSFAGKHYHDLKDRPFYNGLCNFLSSGPVLAMVWEGEGVITCGRKLIGATDPQKSEPGTIRGDLAVVVGRNIIHGSDGPETAKNEISLWFKPEELTNYTSNQEKWAYGVN
uniref:uncharacterized protein LOC122601772 n=1 Tax=Erigeron canadensis TaxID=72917 RepID=UPI001CB8D53C|nr:uncharacterized protein LOC122601772 [Erigeron canadensis]